MTRLRAIALSTVSGITLRNVLPELRLRAGLRLGVIQAFPR